MDLLFITEEKKNISSQTKTPLPITMNTDEVKEGIIAQGVRNLKQFGYPEVNEENILTDIIYSQFFETMLEDNKGKSPSADIAIDEILAKIKGED